MTIKWKPCDNKQWYDNGDNLNSDQINELAILIAVKACCRLQKKKNCKLRLKNLILSKSIEDS